MKKSIFKIAARNLLVSNTKMWVRLVLSIPFALDVFIFKVWLIWAIPIYIILYLFIVPLMVDLRLRWKEDKKILQDIKVGFEKEVQKKKDEKNSLKEDIKTRYYHIKEIEIYPQICGGIKIIFVNEVIKDVKPDIKANGQPLAIHRLEDDHSMICSVKNIKHTDEYILFDNHGQKVKMLNPYYMSFGGKQIKWQWKGHSDEHMIYICGNVVKNYYKNTRYDFDILINHIKYGPYIGTYNETLNCITIKIGQMSVNCDVNKCTLRACFDHELSIDMPKPEMILVNHEMKTELFQNVLENA